MIKPEDDKISHATEFSLFHVQVNAARRPVSKVEGWK